MQKNRALLSEMAENPPFFSVETRENGVFIAISGGFSREKCDFGAKIANRTCHFLFLFFFLL
jgi:hypothetical protein